MNKHVRSEELEGADKVERFPVSSPEKELAFLLGTPIPKAYDRSQKGARKEWRRQLKIYKRYREKHGNLEVTREKERREAEKARELFSTYGHWYAQRAKLPEIIQGLIALLNSNHREGFRKLERIINRDKHLLGIRTSRWYDLHQGLLTDGTVGNGDFQIEGFESDREGEGGTVAFTSLSETGATFYDQRRWEDAEDGEETENRGGPDDSAWVNLRELETPNHLKLNDEAVEARSFKGRSWKGKDPRTGKAWTKEQIEEHKAYVRELEKNARHETIAFLPKWNQAQKLWRRGYRFNIVRDALAKRRLGS